MRETNGFRTGDEHFSSAGDECVENERLNISHTHTASYQRLPNRPWFEIIAAHKYCAVFSLKCGAPPRCVQPKATPLIKKFLFRFRSEKTPALKRALNVQCTDGKSLKDRRKTDDECTKNERWTREEQTMNASNTHTLAERKVNNA